MIIFILSILIKSRKNSMNNQKLGKCIDVSTISVVYEWDRYVYDMLVDILDGMKYQEWKSE